MCHSQYMLKYPEKRGSCCGLHQIPRYMYKQLSPRLLLLRLIFTKHMVRAVLSAIGVSYNGAERQRKFIPLAYVGSVCRAQREN